MKKMKSQKKASDKTIVWMVSGLVLLIVLSTAGYFFYRNWKAEQLARERREDVDRLVEDYLDAKGGTRFDEFVDTLDEQSVEDGGYTKEELSERYDTIFQSIGVDELAVSSQEILFDEETDTYSFTYNADMTTVLGDVENLEFQAMIIETEEQKTVDWDHSLLFPSMEEGDTISLSFTDPDRGTIYDRNENILAGEGNAYEAGLYPAALGEGDEREKRLADISESFDIPVETLENLLAQNWVTDESLVPFEVVDEGKTPEVTGVLYQQTTDRLYPLGEAAAHLTGYVGDVSAEDIENNPLLRAGQVVGKSGLEYRFDRELRGETGGEISIVDSGGDVREVLIENEKKDGESIHLTIDSEVQSELYALFESDPGAASVMDPKTGELLALTSSPSYDPQLFARGISQEAYSNYSENEDQPFLNRATARYAPGSTFKILSALTLLDSGVTTPEKVNTIEGLNWSPDIPGFGDREITRVNDAVTEVDLTDAMVYSDNIYFAMEALELGAEGFAEGLSQFPFGESFAVPLTMEPAQLANEDISDLTLLADTAYGQGEILMNSIHQQSFYSPVLNEGELKMPQLISGNEAEGTEPVASSESVQVVRDMLVETVTSENGTAHALNELDYAVGAKTGTAEIAGEEGNETNGFLYLFDEQNETYSFTGFLEGQSSKDVIERFYPFFSAAELLID